MRNATKIKYATPANAKPNTVRHASHVGVSHPLYFAFCLLCLAISVVILGEAAMAWVENNDSVIASSGDVYSSKRGVTGGFETDLGKTQYILGGNTEAVIQGYIPGDRKYYTFVIEQDYDMLKKAIGPIKITFSLTLAPDVADTATAESGQITQFLSDLCVEENAIEVALLRRTQIMGNMQYDVIPLHDHLHITAGSSPESLTSAAVPSFYQANSPGCKTTVTISGVDWSSATVDGLTWTDGTHTKPTLSLMIFMPIWYRDTGGAQDYEKDCILTISDCTVY